MHAQAAIDVSSPKVFNPDWPDAVSLLIRYQGHAMVLSLASFPSYGAYVHGREGKSGERKFSILRLGDLSHDQDFCLWQTSTPTEQSTDNILHH